MSRSRIRLSHDPATCICRRCTKAREAAWWEEHRPRRRPAEEVAGITAAIQPWHGLRYTSLTGSAAAGNPNAFVQQTTGHSQFRITERYIHAAQTAFPGAAEKADARIFGPVGAA